jgi:o-succinylbenzoate---CoA ligase
MTKDIEVNHMTTTIPNWLQQRAFLTPHRRALTYGDRSWSFAELYEESKVWAYKLAGIGVKKEEAIGVLGTNCPQTIFLLHALQQIGAKTVLLNTRLTVEELVFQVNDANVEKVILDNQLQSKFASLEQDLFVCTYEQLMELPELPLTLRHEFSLNEICSIMYTSGTTGNPKGVQQTYGNHWWSAVGSALNLGLHENDAWLCALPLFHISGYSILIRSVIYGIEVVLMKQFDEKKANEYLCSGHASIMSVVATMLDRMVRELGDNVYHPRFRCMLLGGGPAPKSLLERCVDRQIPVFQTYGMTETASQVVTLSPEHVFSKLGSAGKPLFPVQIEIRVDERVATPNEAGEIVVKGPNVTPGYLNRSDANNERFQNGWFFTGDYGYLDDEGFLYVLDRRSDLIISGGENIYPAEIESVLHSHPAVLEAGVIGIDDDVWGQIPCAFVVLASGVSMEELKNYCTKRLAKYKIPKKFIVVDELPRNASNKLLRRKLKEWIKVNEHAGT